MSPKNTRALFIFCLCFILSFIFIKAQNRTIDSLRKILNSNLADTARIRNIRYLTNEFQGMSEWDSLEKYSSRGLKLALTLKDSFFIVKFYSKIGVGLWSKGRYDEALKKYEIGMVYCRSEQEFSAYYNNMGLVYWDKGELPKALDNFLKSYDIDKKYNNEEGMASSLLNMGLIYDDLRDVKNATRYYYLALELARRINDQETIGKCYNNLGKIYGDRKERDKALDFYFKAFNVSTKIGDKGNVAMVANNIGCIYLDREIADSAIKYLNWSYKTYSAIGDIGGLAIVVNNLAHLYIIKKEFNKAKEILIQAINVNRMTGNFDDLSISYRDLASVYYNTNDLEKAYFYLTAYGNLRDTVLANQNALLLSDIRKQYDIKEAEKVVNLKREADKKIATADKLVAAAEKRRQGFIIFGVVIILAVVIIFSFFLFQRFKLTQKQKGIIESQKHEVEEKQKEILDSIHYAKRIQTTIIANQQFIDENISDNFVYFNPKDIVSGDFYWATRQDHLFYLAICDSTGHGVPGAFMSLLNIGFLTEAINEKGIVQPNAIFNYVRERLVNSISKEGQKDGFDGILVCLDMNTKKISYAAANNEPILIRGDEIIELPKDKMPVGIGERKESFQLFEPVLNKDDSIYFYTDGYADQFGGPKGKKFKYKQLNELLLVMGAMPFMEQKEALKNKFNEWKGDLEQVDDVCIIGIRL
jgi:serine phosphatase RsbU (regulator of sigma subunit)